MSVHLSIKNLNAGYGDSLILHDINLNIEAGTCTALLGRNGMGKTTLINTIMGLTTLHSGSIRLNDVTLNAMQPNKIALLGIGWVPQERGIFASLTVEQNLHVVQKSGSWDLNSIYDFFPRLRERKKNLGHQLSGGEQQMLSIARALITNPKVLLLDEPLEGLAPVTANDLLLSIENLVHSAGMTILIIEQHPKKILPITQQAVILERGKIVHQESSNDLLNNNAALQRWLGV